ncbi:nuclear transport factor 2 family protein [Cryptosporangium arvum]|uniref:Ketosteroid isomerase-like protein n=1 Tax=Cryptosporangium arvum DSM 44712 TaxID=927661 RepID=A0A010ZUK0_9ACTN|nr:nuclear transport factor 2 family protein [Cryptosporangium arvum]EXG82359.1 ketosteroid isomerase-like protein [Cryptosporangium arvum DSM 44712]
MGNTEIAREFIAAYNAHDAERKAALMTEDGRVEFPALNISHGAGWETTSGSNAANLVDDRTIDVQRITASGDAVVIEMLWHGVSKGGPGLAPAGERVEMENCIVLTFRDGLISRYVEYFGRYEGIDLLVLRGRMLERRQPVRSGSPSDRD